MHYGLHRQEKVFDMYGRSSERSTKGNGQTAEEPPVAP
jgi:hypothetical protein